MAQREPMELFWSLPLGELFQRLETSARGLTTAEARRRLQIHGPNRLRESKRSDTLTLLAAQFKSPLILILLVAAGLSFFFNEPIDALIILAISNCASRISKFRNSRFANGNIYGT